ncbi:hypothetical protein PPYR_09999 [Photinus pyralis]|uniref:DUF243 domain-containing protein n=1 Tax=Photinus pyralis TaxID=7054 RepID=A0A5N4AFD4_PHOPY|nr:uncharacterized protein LOC116173559 [Photinus pyralis]KAB0795938.1 hypothetical protein PPYR_09999 [Photinus pyralis]
MKLITGVLSLVAVISARPDVSHLPSGSYLPGGLAGASSGHFGSINNFGGGHIGGGHTSFGSSGGHSNFGSSSGHSNFGVSHGTFGSSHDGHGTGFHDQKHVYFYAAPEEESSGRLRIQLVPNSQRNTKIIFVKAPSYGSLKPEVIAPPSVSEDKTLVYVLVKRPDHGGAITIPAGAGVKPSKPEVYFIKYKTQHDAQQQIVGGLHGQHVGASVPDVGSESSFVSTLDSGVSGIGGTTGSIGSHTHSSNLFTSGTSGSSQFGPAGASGPY